MKHSCKIIVACLLVALCVLPFFACGDNSAYDDSALESKLTELNNKITNLETKVSDSQGDIAALEKELKDAKAKLLLLEGKVDGDPNKVYEMGETVSYSSNGLKLFEITVTDIYIYKEKLTWVPFVFKPYGFFRTYDLGGSIGAQLVDIETNTKTNNDGNIFGSESESVPGTFDYAFSFPTIGNGHKTLYICISSANMFIPFAIYNLSINL